MKKAVFWLIVIVLLVVWVRSGEKKKLSESQPVPPPAATPQPSPSPSPTPLSFADMTRLYGPCARVAVLMYHHIQPEPEAKEKRQTALSTTPEFFRRHLEYLRQKGYIVIKPAHLARFFATGEKLPEKAAIITLDDGYADAYVYALPILRDMGLAATVFLPTGLVDNPGYLTWNQVSQMQGSSLVEFANHTWSHRSSYGTEAVERREIDTADVQLTERGLNVDKVFAYPYGSPSLVVEKILQQNKYQLAFTTVPGTAHCQARRWELPRIRMGNAPLSL